jgi:hypothetical protein
MFDLSSEELIRLEEAAQICRTHFSTVYRWVLKGVPGSSGSRVRLEALRLGAKWVTTRSALQRFAEATTPRPPAESVSLPRATAKRRADSERAEKELEKLGI